MDEAPVQLAKGNKKPEDHILLIPIAGQRMRQGRQRMMTKGQPLCGEDYDGGPLA